MFCGVVMGRVVLLDGDRFLAEAARADLCLEVPSPVRLSEHDALRWRVRGSSAIRFRVALAVDPERSQDEAVAIRMGRMAGGELLAAPWAPLARFADDGRRVASRFVWPALDCPTAAPCMPREATCVLARLAARLLRPVRVERPHVVMAWLLGHEGRKHRGAAAIYVPDRDCASMRKGLWIELREPRDRRGDRIPRV